MSMGFEIDLPVPKAEDFRKCMACDLCEEHVVKLSALTEALNRHSAALEKYVELHSNNVVLHLEPNTGESSYGDRDI